MALDIPDYVEETQRQRYQLIVSLVRVYNYYRVIVGFTLLGLSYQDLLITRLGSLDPRSFYWLTVIYTAGNIATVIMTETVAARFFQRAMVIALVVMADIAVLAGLMHFSGGVSSGMGVLIVISVAAGAIPISGRHSTAIAAFATIAVILSQSYLMLRMPEMNAGLVQAGILGLLYFTVSVAIQYLAKRLRRTEITSLRRAAEIADLERVNRLIVQRMRTGIIMVDGAHMVQMINQSARSLLGLANDERLLTRVPKVLGERLEAWRSDTTMRNAPFQVSPTTPEVQANFSPVRSNDPDAEVIVFLEDTTDVQQRAQQLKLSELARLSSGIAHEIRNPLGAISHAAQLLSESKNLDPGDERLAGIIHEQSDRMNDVVENVLEMSRRRQPKPVRTILLSWLEEFIESFKHGAWSDADIRIMVEPETTQIRIDKSQMSQVLTNLVDNGLRYSERETGTQTLFLSGGVDAATDRPYLNVIDRGPGIEETKLAALFEPFKTTEARGTGLGLYIARELCEANRARLTYARHTDGGSCFRITFAHPDRITR